MLQNHQSKDPKKTTEILLRQEKETHAKTQVVIDFTTQKVIKTTLANGKRHDFRIFKESKLLIKPQTRILADKGYQGIQRLHSHSDIPIKRRKGEPLTKEEKKSNHKLSSKRTIVENVIGFLKRFKVISDRYRNRRKRFGLRFNLIAGLRNYEL